MENTETEEVNKISQKRKIIICCVLAFVMFRIIPILANPMRRPETMSTNYVLNLTPIGTDMEDVIDILEGHRNWHINSPNFERGFRHPLDDSIVGEKSITARGHPSGSGFWPAYMPIYGWLLRTTVSIFWGFDEDGKLIEVFVRQIHGK